MKAPALPLWRLSRVRYERMIDAGLFSPDDDVELLDGLLVAREPQGSRHASEPEPDIAVVRGRLRDDATAHPARPVLVVEVAESSLALDRVRKGALYARAGLAEYWVVNLVDEVLEVYRDPERVPSARGGFRYANVRLLKRNATVTPVAAPRARIRVSTLLP